jgi:RHS repeat-associated protein
LGSDFNFLNESTLGLGFIDWLKKNFQWMFIQAQANTSIGTGFVYDEDGNLLGEYDNGSAAGKGRQEYIWLPTDDGQAVPIGIYKGERFYAVHADHLGTPRLITNDSNKPVWQWPYSAFGNNKPSGILKATPSPKAAITNQPELLKATNAGVEVNLRFPGQYFDEESNLSYNYFRSYSASQGRYSQPDPIGLAGGSNRFAYVSNSPLIAFDPEGLAAAGAAIGGQIGGAIGGRLGPFGFAIGRPLGAAIGSAIEDMCIPESPCEKKRREIEEWIVAMEKKYLEMQLDRNDLFDGPSTGTWEGHIIRYTGMKRRLRNLIDEAVSMGCSVPPRAYELLARPAPGRPTP